MEVILESFELITNPNWIMRNGGLYLVLLILFIETGLFFGFFLPGDPMLFISGMILASADAALHPFNHEIYNLIFWITLFIISTIAGNFVGYWSGYKFGHVFVNEKKKSWVIKPKHIQSAHKIYEEKGNFAILIARFLPVARTFVPIVGGIVKMDLKRFSIFNVLGAILWVITITSLGFVLGENEWIKQNLEWTILALVVLVTAPVVIKLFKKEKTTEA